jgi:2-haloacid dehalogenase
VTAVVFDIGGVLLDWNPRHLYRGLFDGDDEAMEHFLTTVCTPEWNAHHDRGRPLAEGVALLSAEHPEQAELIEAFALRWPETVAGPIDGSVQVLAELVENGTPVYALSNWSAETFALARPRFEFLEWFDGMVISGHEGVIKPEPRIFEILCERWGLQPATTVFVDDTEANVDAARELGFQAIRFHDPPRLRAALVEAEVLEGGGRRT